MFGKKGETDKTRISEGEETDKSSVTSSVTSSDKGKGKVSKCSMIIFDIVTDICNTSESPELE
jgi:hypothetical protein